MDTEQLSMTKKTLVGVQFLFVAFGATVLVPLLIGIDPATALFTAGVGTFLFHFITKGNGAYFSWAVPSPLSPLSSLQPSMGTAGNNRRTNQRFSGVFRHERPSEMAGQETAGQDFSSGSHRSRHHPHRSLPFGQRCGYGKDQLDSLLCIAHHRYPGAYLLQGLDEAGSYHFGGYRGLCHRHLHGRGRFLGRGSGIMGSPVLYPSIPSPIFSWAPFLYMLPVTIAPVLEHIGDVYVVSAVAKKDFVADPGLHRTMLGDGLACLCSAFLGGPPETTYSEVTGAMSITKVTSPAVIRISAATAICFSIVGKLSALLQSIPQAVLGGIMLLLFGTIASVGVQNLMQNKVDMNETRNVIIISVMLTMGLGGAVLSSGSFAISGIGLSAVIGVVLNLVLPKTKKKEA